MDFDDEFCETLLQFQDLLYASPRGLGYEMDRLGLEWGPALRAAAEDCPTGGRDVWRRVTVAVLEAQVVDHHYRLVQGAEVREEVDRRHVTRGLLDAAWMERDYAELEHRARIVARTLPREEIFSWLSEQIDGYCGDDLDLVEDVDALVPLVHRRGLAMWWFDVEITPRTPLELHNLTVVLDFLAAEIRALLPTHSLLIADTDSSPAAELYRYLAREKGHPTQGQVARRAVGGLTRVDVGGGVAIVVLRGPLLLSAAVKCDLFSGGEDVAPPEAFEMQLEEGDLVHLARWEGRYSRLLLRGEGEIFQLDFAE